MLNADFHTDFLIHANKLYDLMLIGILSSVSKDLSFCAYLLTKQREDLIDIEWRFFIATGSQSVIEYEALLRSLGRQTHKSATEAVLKIMRDKDTTYLASAIAFVSQTLYHYRQEALDHLHQQALELQSGLRIENRL